MPSTNHVLRDPLDGSLASTASGPRAGKLARLDGATYPAAVTRAAATFAAVLTVAAAVTAALAPFFS
ncbi:hypothetical protein [Streptomyces mirabilis]|uniref:hypothetical protein n=1 Tax=Streptomyces mirabilis TaxID=68239 RepID=UPI0033AF7250